MARAARICWAPIMLAYVYSMKPCSELAIEFKVSDSAIQKRCYVEGWAALRRQANDAMAAAVSLRIDAERRAEFSKWNEADLRLARAIRGKVAATIAAVKDVSDPLSPLALRQLASAIEATQRVGRLALGATTDNHSVSGPDGGPIPVAQLSTAEYARALRDAIAAF